MEIFIRLLLWLAVGTFFAFVGEYFANKPATYSDNGYELRPSKWSKIFLVLIWLSAVLICLIFWVGYGPEIGKGFVIFWTVAFSFLAYVTVGTLSLRISYDNEYLYMEGLVKSYTYEWVNLVSVREYQNLAAGCLILKFSGRFWVCIPNDFEGFSQLEYHARRFVVNWR